MPPPTLPISGRPAGSQPYDVVGFGECSADLVAVVEGFPLPDSKADLKRFTIMAGGQTATAVTTCARLGWRTRFHGLVGGDEWAQRIEEGLTRHGVDVALIRAPGSPSRLAILIVDRFSGTRTVLEHRDPAHLVRPEDVDAAVVTSGRVLMLDASHLEASIAAARRARAAGIPTVVDVDRPVPGLNALLSEIDIIITDAAFPAAFTGERSVEAGLAAIAARFRPALSVATLGAAGSVALFEGAWLRTAAPAVVAVDTTGAGDAFRGGFVAAWLEAGERAPVERLLETANTVAAMSCQAPGAMGGLPSRQQLDAFVTRRHRG